MADVLRAMALRPQPRKWEQGTPPQELRRYAAGRRVRIVAHPAVFRERSTPKDGALFVPLFPPPRAEWEALGAELALSAEPYCLGPGCWTTGAVPRTSFETAGIAAAMSYREGDALLPDDVADDQAIVINVRDRGLIVLSGCAHAGIVNTVHRARAISGVEQVWAVVGGFHLAHVSAADLQRTVEAVAACQTRLLVPTHCTGPTAIGASVAHMPQQCLPGVIGATYLF